MRTMNSNNFLLSRNFHITEIMCNLDFWLLSAFLNQVFYLFICFLIAFRSDLISGLIERGQTAHCTVCFLSKMHGQQQHYFKTSANWLIFPVQADLKNWKVPQWDQCFRWWRAGAFNSVREEGVYKTSPWVY